MSIMYPSVGIYRGPLPSSWISFEHYHDLPLMEGELGRWEGMTFYEGIATYRERKRYWRNKLRPRKIVLNMGRVDPWSAPPIIWCDEEVRNEKS